MAISNRPEGIGGGAGRAGGSGPNRPAPPKPPKPPKKSTPAPKGDGSSSGRGKLGVSTRSGELDSATKRDVKKQNKAAESYKIKDLDKLEKGQKYRAELKARKEEDKQRLIKNAETKGKIKGAAATAGVVIAAAAVDKKKKTGKK